MCFNFVCVIRFSDAVREAERMKGQLEDKDRDLVTLTRRLEVSLWPLTQTGYVLKTLDI